MEYDPLLFAAKRKILKLTRKQLAEKCKLTQTTIYNIETGKPMSLLLFYLLVLFLIGLLMSKANLTSFIFLRVDNFEKECSCCNPMLKKSVTRQIVMNAD